MLRRASPLVLALSLACGGSKPPASVANTTVSVAAEDSEMNAAMQQAREKVSVFIARLQEPQPTDRGFSVKVPVRDGDQVEHFWLADVKHDNGVFRGTLGNDPELVRGHKFGEPVSVPIAGISDWMFVDRDHLVGGFTVRVIRDRMDPSERAAMDNGLDFKIK